MADDLLKEAQEAFKEAQEKAADNHRSFEKDVRFARLEEQWPSPGSTMDDGSTGRTGLGSFDNEARLTINKLAPIIRQVVNDARQNKPAIKVRPQDSQADPETAEIMTGLIRNIESASDADIAYDTAVDNAVSGGFGYFRVNLKYACDDNWDQDIVIERVPNPLSVLGDPNSTAADSSDWEVAFVTDQMPKKTFEKRFKKGVAQDWPFADFPDNWLEGDQVTVAEYWVRSEVSRDLIVLVDPQTGEQELVSPKDNERGMALIQAGYEVKTKRAVKSYEVKRHLMNGVEVLESVDWAGKWIPIVPVYGDEVVLKNKRYFRSLIRSAIDAQRMYNYWASKTTAVVALAPRAPYIGPKGSFVDEDWDRVNDASIPYLEYDPSKGPAPQRQPFTGVPTGMMQEMMNAAQHIKEVTGIYDASLGARSNEVSGTAINARKIEGDTSTFHFIDNLSRAIRHGGRIVVDLIPKVYDQARIVRTLGEDGKGRPIQLMQPTQATDKKGQPITEPRVDPATGQPVAGPDGQPVLDPVMRVYDLTLGKYDLNVEAGPSYTTRREETRAELVEVIRSVPESAPILGPMYLRNCDWVGAQEAADKMEQAQNPQGAQGVPQEQVQQIVQQGQQALSQQAQKISQLEQQLFGANAALKDKGRELDLKDRELGIKEIEASTRHIEAQRQQFVPSGLA